jgi:hypothetical protein
MGRKITYTVTVSIQVDESDWADEYGMETSEAIGDLHPHLTDYLRETVKHSGLGYMFESVDVRVPRIRVEA